ncbi:hypothetical protein [Sorangium sp. So ce1078]|uniref:hypothetical protein n=1 Tax=Sorangium sp. So ce1078 TaxID=3133329 RepID=UPI003F5E04C9
MKQFMVATLSFSCAFASAGCDAEIPEGGDGRLARGAAAEGVAGDALVAVVETTGGARVHFSKPTSRELVLESIPDGDGDDLLDHVDLDAHDATVVYEAFTGATTPAALLPAQHRFAAFMSDAGVGEAAGTDELAELAPTLLAVPIPAREFDRRYCSIMPLCNLNQGVPFSQERWAKKAEGYIYAARGSVQLHVTRKYVIEGWMPLRNRPVLEGELVPFKVGTWRFRRPIRIDVKNVDPGDVFHIAYRFTR